MSICPSQRRGRRPWFVFALVFASASAQRAPVAAQTAEPLATARAGNFVNDGRIHCALFAGKQLSFVAGATVTVAGGTSALTNARGNAFVSAPAGVHELRIVVPSERLPLRPKSGAASVAIAVPNVTVIAGELTVVMLSLADAGEPLDTDIRLPKARVLLAPGASPPSAAEPAQAQVESGGTLSGQIVSAKTGKPVADAKLYAVGHAAEATTDAEGRFALALPAGSHVLSVVHFDYVGQTLEGVVIERGVEGTLTLRLDPAPVEMDTFVVRAPRIRGSVATLMQERRASFVYVRGLGERYTNALLNGVPLPSPEPDRATVPLDLFPAQILESLDISKTFTPDVPGDFAGGSVRIVTRSVPEKPLFSASLSSALNSESTFQGGYGQLAGGTDFLGWDDGGRALSSKVPTEYPLAIGVERTTNLPNLNGSIAAGDGWSRSGKLVYVRIEYGGYELSAGNEINGLTLGSVGSKTSIHHIMVNTPTASRWTATSRTPTRHARTLRPSTRRCAARARLARTLRSAWCCARTSPAPSTTSRSRALISASTFAAPRRPTTTSASSRKTGFRWAPTTKRRRPRRSRWMTAKTRPVRPAR